MNIYKNTIISSLSILAIGITFTIMSPVIVSILIASVLTIYAAYYFTQNYDINYTYWFSFISQLIGLLLIVSSFVLMMVILFNWIVQHT